MRRLMRKATTESTKSKLYELMCSADTLYKQVKFFHWVVNGDNYIATHRFLDEVSEELTSVVDLVAERLVYLGHVPIFNPKNVYNSSNFKYVDVEKYDGFSSISIIIDGLNVLIKELETITEDSGNEKDYGTQQFVAEVLYKLEVLKHHLQSFGN